MNTTQVKVLTNISRRWLAKNFATTGLVNMSIGGLCVVANVLIIATIMKTAKIRTVNFAFLGVLAVADALVGLARFVTSMDIGPFLVCRTSTATRN